MSCGRRVAGIHLPCNIAPPALARPSAEIPLVPGFRAAELLGSGGFGIVAAAERERDGLRLALKVAHPGVPAAAAQLRREREALLAVGPPAVPALADAGELADGTPWLAMELIRAPSLATRLEARGGALDSEEVGRVALALLDALAAVHAAGWAHGDLKPENVFVEDEPARIRLLDLGLAEPLAAAERTDREAPVGTAEYMAPEQCEGHGADARSDIYAVGVLLLEMAAGRPPFVGSPGEVRHGHLFQRPPIPGSLAAMRPGFEDVILRCLAKAPADRFPSADALRAHLAPLLLAPAPVPGRVALTRAAPAVRSTRRRVGVAFVEATADAVALQEAAASVGGVVAHAERARCALVFDPAAGENPVRMALWAGWRVVARGLASRVRIDLLALTAQPRAGGGERYLSAAFSDPHSWPVAEDPAGVVATSRAADVLPGERLHPLAGRDGLFVHERGGEEEATVVRQGAPMLVGRDDLLADLLSEARAARLGPRPTVLSVVGDAGMGKTHLASVLADRLRVQAPAPEVIALRAQSVAEAEEGNVLRVLLRALLDLPAHASAPADGGRALLGLAFPEGGDEALWAGAALALGWIDPDEPTLRARAAAPGALSSLKVRACSALLRRRAANHAVAVVLDDAQQADGTALDALELAALAEGGAPLFICALARPSFLDARPTWGERAGHARALRLGPLEPAHGSDLCRRLLLPAEAVPARAVEWLVARSQGVPLLMSELVRGLKREGLVRPHSHGGAHFLATDQLDRVPDMPVVDWLAAREVRHLPKDLAAHAQLAALLGDDLGAEEISGVVRALERAGYGGHFPLDAGSATQRLLTLGLLVAHRGGSIGFRLPLVRDALARSAPEALRHAIHEAAFRFYEQGEGVVPEPIRLRRMGFHAAGAGRAAEAGALELRLAEELAANHSYVEAEARYSRALQHLPEEDSVERLRALRGRGLMHSVVGRHEEAIEDLVGARALARRRGDRRAEVACLLDEATALDWTADFGRSRARAEEAASIGGGLDWGLSARLELARGRSLFRSGRWEEAAAALVSCAALAERLGDGSYEPLVAALLLLGTALPAMGRVSEGEAALERARVLAAARGDLVHVGAVLINRRNLLVARQDVAGALRDQQESIRISRELGRVATEYVSEYNLAELHYQTGDVDGAEPHVRRGIEIEQRHPEVAPLPLSALLWARLLLFTGDVTAARRRHAEFLDGLARARAHGVGLGPAEAVLADMVELATRGASDAEWEALAARSARDALEQEPIEVLEMRGLTALRAGRVEDGREALRSALDVAARIPNLLAPRVRGELERATAG